MKKEVDNLRFDEAIKLHKKNGIHTYTLTTESGKQCLIKQPNILVTGKIMPYLMPVGDLQADYIKAANVLVDECWIAGDDAIRKDEELKAEIGISALNLVQMKIATVKKN